MFNNDFFDIFYINNVFLSEIEKQTSSFLPITVVVAIILFLIKESLEIFKRKAADKRKISAMKTLFSRECEKNLYTINTLRKAFSVINEANDEYSDITVDARFSEYDKTYLNIIKTVDGKKIEYSSRITKVYQEVMERNLMEAAIMNSDFFKKLEAAFDSLIELEHIRHSFLNIEDMGKIIGHDLLLGLTTYALKELDPIYSSLNDLYKYCTGNELVDSRLR
ncbi:hypothetical protein [Yersinia enterocolitica]|uniref:hypothetical protein n=1 Tax=Yersinia enterocolitica TaxID=630 RepID=UPI003D090225